MFQECPDLCPLPVKTGRFVCVRVLVGHLSLDSPEFSEYVHLQVIAE